MVVGNNKSRQARKSTSRAALGSSILELPAAMLILFLFIFFPILDIIGVGIKYGACAALNGLQLHEASLLPKSKATDVGGTVKKGIPDRWLTGGMGAFVNPSKAPETEVTYRDGENTANGTDKLVNVKTTIQLPPFITSPFIPNIPGLSAPLNLTVEGERPLENPFNVES